MQTYGQHEEIMTALANATSKVVPKLLAMSRFDEDTMKAFLVLQENPWLLKHERYHVVIEAFATAIVGLPTAGMVRTLSQPLHARALFRFISLSSTPRARTNTSLPPSLSLSHARARTHTQTNTPRAHTPELTRLTRYA